MDITTFKEIFNKLPKWLRIVILTIIAAIGVTAYCFISTSCSSLRVVQKASGTIEVRSNMSTLDSTSVNITLFNKTE